jgi:hypothetical protein
LDLVAEIGNSFDHLPFAMRYLRGLDWVSDGPNTSVSCMQGITSHTDLKMEHFRPGAA